MAVLSRIGAVSMVITSSCYSPELRECTVRCATAADCAPGQICGTDRMCASPAVAGRCSLANDMVDAAIDSTVNVDAAVPPDAAPGDAATQLVLRIEINNRGGVTVAGVGTCHHTAPLHTCSFDVTAGAVAQLVAEPDPDYRFDKWESGPCVGEGETCAFLPTLPLTAVKAKFRSAD